ncbi:hypothetical protein BKA01_005796 [Pseudonocardia eucalypti]|nr:hypothetical protein [Pseudonocardia eucalypti]
MTMERLQILLRPEQAARLRDAARAKGVPVTELVRDAIDQAIPYPRAPERLAALEEFKALPKVSPAPTPEELEAILDERTDKFLPPPSG